MNLHNLKTLATQDLYGALEVWSRKVCLMSSARKCGIREVFTGDWEDLFSDTMLSGRNLPNFYQITWSYVQVSSNST
jgi:hypothetical protein